MTTSFAFLGQFGDAIDFIFNEHTSPAGGAQVGGLSNMWDLIWEHLKLSLEAMAIACGLSIPLGLWLGHIGKGGFLAINASILTNTYTAVRQVERDTVDAARGMGMTGPQIVRRVELPLSLPLIFGGIRISAVNVIATATIAPLAGVITLGDPIINVNTYGEEGRLAAAIVVALLAVLTELSLGAVQRALTPRGLKLTRAGARRHMFPITRREATS